MSQQLFNFFVSASILSSLVPICIYGFTWTTQPKQNHFIGAFLLTTFLLDALIFFLALHSVPTTILSNLFSAISFITITGFYYGIVFHKRGKIVFAITLFAFVTSSISFAIANPITTALTFYWATNAALISTQSLTYMLLLPSMKCERYLDRNLYSNLTIHLALLLYFIPAATILFPFAGFVFTDLTPNEARIFWTSHNVINIFKNLGIAVGLYLTGKRNPYISLAWFEQIGKKKE
jgi:hypothetical protein